MGRWGDAETRRHGVILRVSESPRRPIALSPHLRIAPSPCLYVPSDSGLRLNHESVS
jgi:hypothetical protein